MAGWMGRTPADIAQALSGSGLGEAHRTKPRQGWSPADVLAEMESAFLPAELDSLKRQWAEAGRRDGMGFGC